MKQIKHVLMILLIILSSAAWLDPYKDKVSSGNNYFMEGDYSNAIEQYKEAEEYVPSKKELPNLAYNQANAYAAMKNYEKAEEKYREALKSDNKDVQKKALYNLGNMYEEKEDYDSAVKSYINALRVDPSYEKAKKNLEYILNRKENKKNNDEKSDDKKDKQNKNENKKDENKNSDTNKEKEKSSGKLSKIQIDRILNNYNNMPVRRKKGSGENGTEQLEKDW